MVVGHKKKKPHRNIIIEHSILHAFTGCGTIVIFARSFPVDVVYNNIMYRIIFQTCSLPFFLYVIN